MPATPEAPCAIYAANVTVGAAPGTARRSMLREFSLAVTEGELIFVIGGSDSGKSALIRALAGIQRPVAGEILLSGVSAPSLRRELPLAIGYLAAPFSFTPELTVREILEFAIALRLPRTVAPRVRRDWLRQIIEWTGLDHLLGRRSAILNAAEKCRLALAEALSGDPVFLFLDELTRGLDPNTDYELMRCLKALAHKFGKTIVLSTQQMKSLSLCDRIVLLHEGRSPFQGTFDELWATHKTQSSRALFGCYYDASRRGHFAQMNLTIPELPARPDAQAIRSSAPADLLSQTTALLRRQGLVLLRSGPRWFAQPGLWLCLVWSLLAAFQMHVGSHSPGLDWALVIGSALLGVQNGSAVGTFGDDIIRKEVQTGLSAGALVLAKWVKLAVLALAQALIMTGLITIIGLESDVGPWLFSCLFLCILTVSLVCLPISIFSRSRERAALRSLVVLATEALLATPLFPVAHVLASIFVVLNTLAVVRILFAHLVSSATSGDGISNAVGSAILDPSGSILILLLHGVAGLVAAWIIVARER